MVAVVRLLYQSVMVKLKLSLQPVLSGHWSIYNMFLFSIHPCFLSHKGIFFGTLGRSTRPWDEC